MEEAEADFEANIADLAMRFNPTLEPQPPPGSDYPTLEKDDDDVGDISFLAIGGLHP